MQLKRLVVKSLSVINSLLKLFKDDCIVVDRAHSWTFPNLTSMGVNQAVNEYLTTHLEYVAARPRVGFIQTEQIILVKG
jgi:hypothetical protein